MDFEQELKEHGVNVVCSKMDTIISVHIHGASGKRLVETLQLVDTFVASKVAKLAKSCEGRIYCDPCFGPNDADAMGMLALCKHGDVIPSKGGSQHQAKIIKMVKEDKLKWQRPIYAAETKDVLDENEDSDNPTTSDDPVFCEEGQLFTKSANSGDVIQGNLGDCWFLGAISVLATRMELLTQAFWREDQYKKHGMFVCRFMKDFTWHYVVLDDRIPVFGYTNNRAGKPFFARCSDPNELWVPLIEKAYAKLHGCYEALIGGYIDVALSDLTGLCSEQIILKPDHPGFGDDPFAPKPGEQAGDGFWKRLLQYKRNGTLMGCSIQPDPKSNKNIVAEGSAGQGLYYKHAYGLVDVGEIQLDNNQMQRLVKLRNPWGMGEWTGAWSDQSDEREKYEGEIYRVFKSVMRQVGANVLTTMHTKRKVRLVTEPQEEVTEVNQNDGTFFMSYEDWRARYTHFFAGIDFADEWCGLRVHGNWDDTSNGGNTTKSTWINNPRYQLLVKERCHLYISMSQHDPRGTADPAIFPIGFHICTLQEVKGNKFEVKEPPKKAPPYYRLYQKASQAGLCNGTILEPIPPAIIPGSVIPGIDNDGVPQPSYTLKQAVTVDLVIEPGHYCIIPSMYMRTNKDTGRTATGRFWISVYGQQPVFHLEGGQPIVEEEEMPESAPPLQAVAPSSAMQAPVFKEISVPGAAQHRQFENLKDEMLAHARAKGIGYREVKREFANAGALRKADFKRRMMNLGFKMDEMSDDKVLILFNGMDKDKSNTIQADELLDCFMLDIEEDRIASVVPEKEDEEVPEKVNQEGTLEVHVIGGKDLQSAEIKQHTLPLLTLPSVSFSSKEALRHDTCALEILEEKPALLQDLHVAFLHALNVTDATFHKRIQELVAKYKQPKQKVNPRGPKKKLIRHDTTPVQQFFDLVQARLDALAAATNSNNSPPKEKQASDVRKPFNWANLEATDTCGPAVVVRLPTTEQKLLHSSPYMQALETKRWTMFHQICQRKAQVFGDKQRQANLPRLIGGRKSGTNTVHCSDCNRTIVVSGKQDHDHMCMAQGCVNLFCAPCYEKMAANDKFCDDCYLHENGNIEVLGMQLRTMLMSKLAATDVQLEALDQIFHSLDENHSGDLSRDEFVHLLDKLRMHPPLTPNQIDGVFEELDVDNNGSLSFEEFKMWLLGRESMWSPRVPDDSGEDIAIPIHELLSPTREAIVHDKKSAGLVTFVQSVVDDMVTDACGMSTRSPWLFNSQPIEKREFDKQLEREHVLFQRLGTIQLMDNTMDDTGGIAKLFSKFDVNGDGSIEIDELSYLVQSIGLTASPVDLRLLAHRLRREDDGTIHLADFVTFLQRTTPSHERALLDKIIELEHLCKEHRIQEADVKHILRNFYIGMDTHELAWMAKQLHDLIGWTVDLSMLQRIALVCTPCIFDTNDSKVVCAGDVLLALFSAPAGFAGSLASYSIQAVSDAIQHLFKIESPDVEEDLEWEKLGQLPQAEMPQAKFVECLLRRGLKLVGDSLGIESQVCVALALDTLRYREGVGHTMFSSTVTRGLFTSLSRYSTLTALEQQMRHILQQMARVGSGQQFYQTVITRGSSPDEALKVYVIDPSVHQVMMHAFHESDFSVNGVALFADNVAAAMNPFQRGVVHDLWYPELNTYFLGLLKRFRILYTEDKKTPSLAFLESDALVAKLRSVFSSYRVPFFWTVSAASLQISVDHAALDQSKLRLLPCVIQSILKFSAIASFLRQIHSTIRVQIEVIDKPLSMWMSWSEFKSCLAGLQNAYTFVQLLPQGDIFHTPHDVGGGCTPQWNFSTKVTVAEPKECIHRTDRPVVYVDTQPILGKPDSTGENLIPFTTLTKLNSSKNKQHSKGEKNPTLHFVVLSVRRTVPKSSDKPTLYCTAYDPITASDYEVVGTPTNWPVNFFDPDVNKNYEAEWLAMLGNLKLGRTITPKLFIRVYNKQPRSDQLIGETEVSVASMMAREGYGIKSWFSIYDPVTEKCTGQIELHAHFQIRTLGQSVETLAPVPHDKSIPKLIVPSSKVKLDLIVDSKAAAPSPSVKVLPSSQQLPTNSNEAALKERINELEKKLALESNMAASSDSTKWKKKYEQLKQQTTDEQAQAEKKVQLLKEEIVALNNKASNPLSVEDFSAPTTLAAMKAILYSRCPERPFNGLKKAMAAVVDSPGKISIVACEEVLDDFGLALNATQKRNLFRCLDPDTVGVFSIEDFLVKLNGDMARSLSKQKLENNGTQIPSAPRHASMAVSKSKEMLPKLSALHSTSHDIPAALDTTVKSTTNSHDGHTSGSELVSHAERKALEKMVDQTIENAPVEEPQEKPNKINPAVDDKAIKIEADTVNVPRKEHATPRSNHPSDTEVHGGNNVALGDQKKPPSKPNAHLKAAEKLATEIPIQPMTKPAAAKQSKPPNNHVQFANDAELHKYLAQQLPEKWDMQFTPKGKPYFRNFTTRSTQWNHPVADVDALYRAYVLQKKEGASKQISESKAIGL
ncbi:hypothetical protein, variant 1 [Aphanomyces invadans]|uniref:Uncharacterized protein n=1 Tax=Aphanomyces invadans TaxID=157072 RepID=A0A024UC93_9STRA|nr:hypothetical protein, variant 1 [Aphanomyces invadans]ETW03497.1 hypothetical protein, variant 1 [Aphanomyces invadans]|eukprot:XP_008867726.1 hypothetical protein, variant 1 [Aphanomyces invadans]